MKKSFAVQLSLRFMFILTMAVILLSVSFLYVLRYFVQASKSAEMKRAGAELYEDLKSCSSGDDELILRTEELPYYLTYIAYDVESEQVIATNDLFLPLLKDTKGKTLHYFEKDFFYDGDLDILYYAEGYELAGKKIIIAVAENIENDSFSKIFPQLPFALLLMALPVLLLSFLLLLFLTKNTIKPVVKITRAARLMNTENLEGQLPLSGRGDEIDELSKTFNELFCRIKADFDRERQFSSDVSHELNTPLTVISGQAGLLLRWGKDNPEQLEKSLNAIKDEAKSMHAIIENLLQISRIESGRIKPQLCEVDVSELFDRVTQEIAAVSPEVRFELSCEQGLPLVNTDPEMLHQIITVFVSNSIKFAGEACVIKLSAMRDESGRIMLSESDDGPGISESALPHVFERFYRADEAHTRSVGGSGLGLSIAKTLSEALGADIRAGNVEPHGALFQLYLPA